MSCERCDSERVAKVSGKCNDMFSLKFKNIEIQGDYVPHDIGIGGGDYMNFSYCLDCGNIQGVWPRLNTRMEEKRKMKNKKKAKEQASTKTKNCGTKKSC